MLCADVNVLVDLANRDAPRHAAVRTWWSSTVMSTEPVIVPDFVAASFIRVVTDRRILPRPVRSDEAFAFLDRLLESPRVALATGSSGSWTRFVDLTVGLGLTGNDVPDAHLAALALHMDAAVVTADRGFRRFPGLRVIDPAA
jgi:uncharacterized protein